MALSIIDQIQVRIMRDSDTTLCLVYRGTREALLSGGAISESELAPARRSTIRYDAWGDRYSIERPKRGFPGVLTVWRWKVEDSATQFPGVTEWLAEESGMPSSVCREVDDLLKQFRRQSG